MARAWWVVGCVLAACGTNDQTPGDGGMNGDGTMMQGDGGMPPPPDDSGPHPPVAACTTLSTLMVRAPTYFVDFGSGSDAADGKTTGAAWKHAPGDANATGVAAAATLKAGDVVQLKGGVPYLGTITIKTSGTAQAPIVFDGGPQNGYGAGKAIIDGETKRSLGIAVQGASYVVVEGFELRNFDKTQGSTAISVDGGGHDEVRGNTMHDIYYAKNPGGTSWEAQRGTGISVNNSAGTNVYANFVRDVGNAGITFTANGQDIKGGEIACNEVTNMNWGIALALGDSKPNTHLSGLTVARNYIHDFDQYYVCNAWHRDGIFAFARPDNGTLTIDDIELAYNYFEDNTSAVGSTAWIYIEFVCRNFNVHHNVLNASRSYYAIRILGDGFQVMGNHILANNVIANQNGIGAGMHVQESTGLQLVNNIFYDDDVAYIIATDSMTGFTADYDILWRTDGNKKVGTLQAGPANNPGGMSYDLAGLQGLGYEKNGIQADPQWSMPFKMIDADATGFKPTASSPAKDKGKMLTYAVDFAGTMIPQGAGPDMGAFEQ